jgi:hypothetical protein
MRLIQQLGAAMACVGLVASCQGKAVAPSPSLAVDRMPVTMAEPAVMDWATQRVSGERLVTRRDAAMKRRVQAFSQAAPWSITGDAVSGYTSTGVTIPAGDYVPNGPATVYGTAGTPAVCFNALFYLTQSGKLVRMARDRSAWNTINLGRTFTKTYITLSPAGGRAYLLADDGTFLVVNTGVTPMTFQTFSGAATGNQGLAPVLDPFVSNPADFSDTVYVPYSNGTVSRYTVKAVGDTPTVTPATVTTTGSYMPAGPLKANPVVLGGVIYMGDTNGDFVRFDTSTSAVLSTHPLGYPVLASPALDMDDSGNITDAFVNAGTQCRWIKFSDSTVTGSPALYLDEGDTKTSGTLNQWTYTSTPIKYWLAPVQALSINRDTGGLAPKYLNGYTSFKTQAYLGVADTNTRPEGPENVGGPVDVLMRWDIQNSPLPSTATITSIKLWMKNLTPVRQTRRFGVFGMSAYLSAGVPWTFANITAPTQMALTKPAAYSPIGTLNMTGVTVTPQNRVYWNPDTWYNWNISNLTVSPQYALSVWNDPNGDNIMWPELRNGLPPATEDSGNAAQKSDRRGPQFYYDPSLTNYSYLTGNAIADPTAIPGATGDNRPLLEISAFAKALNSLSITSPPIIDTFNGRKFVYVVNGNAVFGLNFSSAAAFGDPVSTRFQVLTTGRKGFGPNATNIPYGPVYPPSGGSLYVVENRTAPLLTFDGAALFALGRYPTNNTTTPTAYIYSLDRISLGAGGLSTTANYQEYNRSGPSYYLANKEASSHMVIDYFNYNQSTGAIHFGLPPTTAAGSYGTLVRVNQ